SQRQRTMLAGPARLTGREDARHALALQLRGKLDSALAAPQLDVDERQMRGSFPQEPEGFGSAACRPHHPMTHIAERFGQQQAKQDFVLDDQNVHDDTAPISPQPKQDEEESSPNLLQIGG